MALIILDLDERQEQVLREALECHREGLKEAIPAATADRTLENPEDLTIATGTMMEDIAICDEILGVVNVNASH